MNFLKKIVDSLKKIFGKAKEWYVRAGLGKFLDKHVATALQVIVALAAVNSNVAFHEWKDQAFVQVKSIVGDVSDNWIAIALGVAYELFKASNSVTVEKL